MDQIWIISNLVEGNIGFPSEKISILRSSANGKYSLLPIGPIPGKKAFASPKMEVLPLFPIRASAVSARPCLSHRVSLRRPGQ
jgi:hypothetical protein